MIEQNSLSTSRLILRPFSLTDATELQHLAGDKVIADTTVSIPHPYNFCIAQDKIKTYQQDFIEGKAVHFANALPCRQAYRFETSAKSNRKRRNIESLSVNAGGVKPTFSKDVRGFNFDLVP